MAKRLVNGMHISNHRHWFIEDQIKASKLTGAVTILHHLMVPRDPIADQWGDPENEYWFVKLRDGWEPQGIPVAPERLVHVRMYHANWCSLDPAVWGEHAVRMLERVVSGGNVYNLWDDPYVCVSAGNEQNLHYECGDNDPANQWRYATTAHYEKIARWNLDFWRTIDQLAPGRRALSCWSALAQGHDPDGNSIPDSEYDIAALREAVSYCDLFATHPYGHLDWPNGADTVPGGEDRYWHMLRDFRPVGWRDGLEPDKPHDPGGSLAHFPGKATLLSESGTFTHSDEARTSETLAAMRGLLRAAADCAQIVGCTWFIGNSDAHQANCIVTNEALRLALVDLEPYETEASIPVHTATPPQPPTQWKPRLTDAVRPTAVVQPGQGWAQFAGWAAGLPEAPYQVRLKWAREIAELNGGSVSDPPVSGRAYALPWFEVALKA